MRPIRFKLVDLTIKEIFFNGEVLLMNLLKDLIKELQLKKCLSEVYQLTQKIFTKWKVKELN